MLAKVMAMVSLGAGVTSSVLMVTSPSTTTAFPVMRFIRRSLVMPLSVSRPSPPPDLITVIVRTEDALVPVSARVSRSSPVSVPVPVPLRENFSTSPSVSETFMT